MKGGIETGDSADDVRVVEAEPGGRAIADVAALFDVSPDESWRAVPGRTTFPWPQPDARFVVKRIHGDVGRERLYDRLHGLAERTPAGREFDALTGLASAGFPVPAPVLHAHSRRRGLSLLAMELVPHRASLRQAILADGDPPLRARTEAARAAALAARLHCAGWYHRDLYLQHLVLRDQDGALCLLDLGRARRERRPRRRWFEKDVAALVASAPPAVRDAFARALLDAYFERAELARRAQASFERAVRRRAARIERHVPKEVDPDTREGTASERDVDGRYL
ncbi:MAG: lipopolysaccharide kinase InaA family protein [Planctomycetota bacterium]